MVKKRNASSGIFKIINKRKDLARVNLGSLICVNAYMDCMGEGYYMTSKKGVLAKRERDHFMIIEPVLHSFSKALSDDPNDHTYLRRFCLPGKKYFSCGIAKKYFSHYGKDDLAFSHCEELLFKDISQEYIDSIKILLGEKQKKVRIKYRAIVKSLQEEADELADNIEYYSKDL